MEAGPRGCVEVARARGRQAAVFNRQTVVCRQCHHVLAVVVERQSRHADPSGIRPCPPVRRSPHSASLAQRLPQSTTDTRYISGRRSQCRAGSLRTAPYLHVHRLPGPDPRQHLRRAPRHSPVAHAARPRLVPRIPLARAARLRRARRTRQARAHQALLDATHSTTSRASRGHRHLRTSSARAVHVRRGAVLLTTRQPLPVPLRRLRPGDRHSARAQTVYQA